MKGDEPISSTYTLKISHDSNVWDCLVVFKLDHLSVFSSKLHETNCIWKIILIPITFMKIGILNFIIFKVKLHMESSNKSVMFLACHFNKQLSVFNVYLYHSRHPFLFNILSNYIKNESYINQTNQNYPSKTKSLSQWLKKPFPFTFLLLPCQRSPYLLQIC
jgi:hypothetical protein